MVTDLAIEETHFANVKQIKFFADAIRDRISDTGNGQFNALRKR